MHNFLKNKRMARLRGVEVRPLLPEDSLSPFSRGQTTEVISIIYFGGLLPGATSRGGKTESIVTRTSVEEWK